MIILNGVTLQAQITIFGDLEINKEEISKVLKTEGINTIIYRANAVLQPETTLEILKQIAGLNVKAILELFILKFPNFQSKPRLVWFAKELQELAFNRVYIMHPPKLPKVLTNTIPMYPMKQVLKNIIDGDAEKKSLVYYSLTDNKETNDFLLQHKLTIRDENKSIPEDSAVLLIALEWNVKIIDAIKQYTESEDKIQLCILHLPAEILINPAFKELIEEKVEKIYTASTYCVEMNEEIKQMVDDKFLDITLV